MPHPTPEFTGPPGRSPAGRQAAAQPRNPAGEQTGRENEMPRVLDAAAAHIRQQAAVYLGASKVPGYLAGVYHDGG